MNIYTLLSGLFLFILILPTTAFGAQFSVDGEYLLAGDEVIQDDLYVVGEFVSLGGRVVGDVMTAGGTVNILGRISENLSAAGGTVLISENIARDALLLGGEVTVLGEVGDDLRALGGNVIIGGNVGDDVVTAGGVVHLSPGVSVRGDAFIAGGMVLVDGSVGGDTTIYGEEVTIHGTLSGDVTIEATRSVTVGEGAVIAGTFTYEAPEEATIEEGAVIRGETTFNEKEGKEQSGRGEGVASFMTMLTFTGALMSLLFGLLSVYIFKKGSEVIVTHTEEQFLKKVLKGFATLVVTPIGVILIAVSLLGLPIAGIVGFLYLSIVLSVKFFMPVVLGVLAYKKIAKKDEYRIDWLTVLFGVALMLVLSVVPLIGWIILFVVFLATLGGVTDILFKILGKGR